jgi:phosphoesterase RecJ-like protein
LSELKTKIYDVSIAVDSPNIDRLGIYKDLFKNAKQTIVIDHHQTSLNFGQTNIIENASSTSEIIFNILENFHYSFTVSNYENIYSGIITDTNNFTTPNTNKNTFLIASKIIEKINFVEIYDNLFSNYPINSIKLLSYAYKNIISLKNNQILISYLNKKHYKKTKTNQNNISGIVNKISTISGNILTCLIFEKNNNFYVSLRAKNGYNVAEIAKKFNGGGHAGAAGFLTKLSIKKIIKLISKEFLNILI